MNSRLKMCRLQAGFAQKYVATALGVSNQTVSYWENGLRNPSAENYKQLADLFNVSVDYLMGVPEPNEKEKEVVQQSAQVGDVFITTVPQIAAMGREMEKMTPAQRDRLLAVGKALFKEFFNKEAE